MNPLSQLFSAIGPSGMGPLDTPMWNQRLDLSTPMNNLFRGPMVTPIQQQSPMTMTTPIGSYAPQPFINPMYEEALGPLQSWVPSEERGSFSMHPGLMGFTEQPIIDAMKQASLGWVPPNRAEFHPPLGMEEINAPLGEYLNYPGMKKELYKDVPYTNKPLPGYESSGVGGVYDYNTGKVHYTPRMEMYPGDEKDNILHELQHKITMKDIFGSLFGKAASGEIPYSREMRLLSELLSYSAEQRSMKGTNINKRLKEGKKKADYALDLEKLYTQKPTFTGSK